MSELDDLTLKMLSESNARVTAILDQGRADMQKLCDQLHHHVANPLELKATQFGQAAKVYKEIVDGNAE